MSRNDFYQAPGKERIKEILFHVGDALAADPSNYHTFTFRVVRSGQTTGEDIASYSTASRDLAASEDVEAYNDRNGLQMNEGDKLSVTITETGTPTTLERLFVGIKRIRSV